MGVRTLTPTEVDMVKVVRARACGCDLCGSAMSNGGYSGATKGDSSLCVVRKAVTAASRRIAEGGRRSCSLALRKIPAVHAD